jgi:hypothetical protein
VSTPAPTDAGQPAAEFDAGQNDVAAVASDTPSAAPVAAERPDDDEARRAAREEPPNV